MGDLVLGRLLRAVDTERSDGPSARAWVPHRELQRTLAATSIEHAERAGRQLIDHDVRVGPYRFLRSELWLSSIDVVGPAIFRSYFSNPRVEFRATERSLELRWVEPRPRSERFWALVDGMGKRIIELARVEATDWSVTVDGEQRTLRARLGPAS